MKIIEILKKLLYHISKTQIEKEMENANAKLFLERFK